MYTDTVCMRVLHTSIGAHCGKHEIAAASGIVAEDLIILNNNYDW